MCIPAGVEKKEAISILTEMLGCNRDGFGIGFVQDNAFVIHKYPAPLSEVLKKNTPCFSHLPHDGWTLYHLRKASYGPKTYENCHPFISSSKRLIGIHNGNCNSESKIVRLALSNQVKFESETDTEPLVELISRIGPEKVLRELSFIGVFACLDIKGYLHIIKTSTSSDLEFHIRKNGTFIISSEFPSGYKSLGAMEAYYKFSPEGKYIIHKKKESKWINGSWTPDKLVAPKSDIFKFVRNYTLADWDKEKLREIGDTYKVKVYNRNSEFFGGCE